MRLQQRFSLFAAALAGLVTLAPAAAAEAGCSAKTEAALAFTSVSVLPMTAGEAVLRDQTVLVEDGCIAAIGPSASVPVPAHATRISGQGKYLMPGLADMHAHLEHFDQATYLKLFLVNGVTTVRSMDGRPNILDWKRQAAAATLASPDIHTAGPILDGSPPARDDNLSLATPEEARRTVEQQAAAGYDFIKVYANLSPDVFHTAVQTAAERNMQVAGHVPEAVTLDDFLTSGVASLEHLGDFAESITTPSAGSSAAPKSMKRRLGVTADQARMEALAKKVAASGVWVVPTMIQSDRAVAPIAVIDQWAKSPEAATLDPGVLDWWRGSVRRAAERVGDANWRWVDQARTNRLALVRTFHNAGVRLLVGSDTPNPFVIPGFSIHEELANFVAAGLTPSQALAAATREPARFLGQEQSWGTIERGKRANLLLLDSNPLTDIGSTRRIAGVVVGGRWLSPERLAQMRQDVERLAASEGSTGD